MMRSLRATFVGRPCFKVILHDSFVPQHKGLNSRLDSRADNLRYFLEIAAVEDVQARIDMIGACDGPNGSIGVDCHQLGHRVLVECPVCLDVLDFSGAAGGKSGASNCRSLEAFDLQDVRNGPSIVLRVHDQEPSPDDGVSILDEQTLPLLILKKRIALADRRAFVDIGDLVGVDYHLLNLVVAQGCLGVHEDS